MISIIETTIKVHAQSLPDGITPQMIVERLPDVERVRDADMIYPIFIISSMEYSALQFITDVERLADATAPE